MARYAAGDYQGVADDFRERFRSASDVRAFIEQAPAATRLLDHSTAAAFYLEAGIVSYDVDQDQWALIIEMGRKHAKSASRAFELDWYHTVVTWLKGPPPPASVRRVQTYMPGFQYNDALLGRGDDFPKDREDHSLVPTRFVNEALARFPDDPDLRLAVKQHEVVRFYNFLNLRNVVLQVPALHGTNMRIHPPSPTELSKGLEDLTSVGSTDQRARAMIYLGFFRHFGKATDEAVAWYDKATATSGNPRLQYVALLLKARALWGVKGRLPEAAASLHGAVRLFPEGQTAHRFLAAVLFLTGDTEQAGGIVDRMLSGPANDDPWWDFLRGDYHEWPDRLAKVRADLR